MKLLVSTRGPCWAVAGQDRHFASQPHGVELNHPCGLTVDGTSPSASMCPSPSRVRLRQRTAPSRSEDALIRGGHPGTRCMTRLTVTGNECRRRVCLTFEMFLEIEEKRRNAAVNKGKNKSALFFCYHRFPQYSTWCTASRCRTALWSSFLVPFVVCAPSYFVFRMAKYQLDDLGSVISDRLSIANKISTTIREQPVNENGTLEILYIVDAERSQQKEFFHQLNLWVLGVVVKLLPCAILTVISCWLIKALYRAKGRKEALKSYNQCNNTMNVGNGLVQRRPSRSEKRANRTTKMLVAVLLLFLVTEIPQGILFLLSGVLGDSFFLNCYNNLGEAVPHHVRSAVQTKDHEEMATRHAADRRTEHLRMMQAECSTDHASLEVAHLLGSSPKLPLIWVPPAKGGVDLIDEETMRHRVDEVNCSLGKVVGQPVSKFPSNIMVQLMILRVVFIT
ncbi:hypothetical protein WN48_03967 [Eufriesea mexicana]|nr:hypothetical protein WN48_03967 [Eufriesea mexicana]